MDLKKLNKLYDCPRQEFIDSKELEFDAPLSDPNFETVQFPTDKEVEKNIVTNLAEIIQRGLKTQSEK